MYLRDTRTRFVEFLNFSINYHNFILFLLCILDLENRDYRKCLFIWSINFKDINF